MHEKQTHITDDFFGQLTEIEPGQQWMDGLKARLQASQKRKQPPYYVQGAALLALAVLVNALVFVSGLQKTKPEENNHYQLIYQELMIVPTNSGSNS